MSNEKKWILPIAVILLIVLLMVPTLMLHISRNYILNETEIMLGVISTTDLDSLALTFQHYLALDKAERQRSAAAGLQVMEDAGYAYTAPKHFTRGLWKAQLPILVISLVAGIFLGAIIVLQVLKQKQIVARSARKLSEQAAEMESLEARQKEMMEEIERYEENLYHQLKTPLTSLRLCIDKMESFVPPQSQAWNTYQMANLQISKLARLVSLFLRDRKLSSNLIKFNYQLAAFDCLIEDTIKNLQAQFEFKHVSIQQKYPDHDCFLRCDETWLAECLISLLENAVEHSPENGEVNVSLIHDNGKYRVKIASSGAWLDPDELSDIFTRFHSTKPGHWGIGLHMAMMIAEFHHGKLIAYNIGDAGEGVCFELILPILDGEEAYGVTNL